MNNNQFNPFIAPPSQSNPQHTTFAFNKPSKFIKFSWTLNPHNSLGAAILMDSGHHCFVLRPLRPSGGCSTPYSITSGTKTRRPTPQAQVETSALTAICTSIA